MSTKRATSTSITSSILFLVPKSAVSSGTLDLISEPPLLRRFRLADIVLLSCAAVISKFLNCPENSDEPQGDSKPGYHTVEFARSSVSGNPTTQASEDKGVDTNQMLE